MNVFELMIEYIKEGRIKIDPQKFSGKRVTLHDPCNYGRKAKKATGKGYCEEMRWITEQIADTFVEAGPTDYNNFCCGAGGGAWAMPYDKERIYYGRKKAEQFKACEAEIVVAPCHNCRDQIMKSLAKEYDLDIETFYLWELLAEAIIVEPWSDEEVAKAKKEAEEQWNALGVDLDDMEY